MTKRSQVTTKKGDNGTTATLAGERCSKSDIRIEAVGAVDLLRCQLAILRLMASEDSQAVNYVKDIETWCLWCFAIGSICSDPELKKPAYHSRKITQEDLAQLEQLQSSLEETTRLPRSFILCAATPLAAQCDVCCVTCRTLERRVVALTEAVPRFDGKVELAFLNRLSDCLYMLARTLEKGCYISV